jgi:hypothetical protein
VCEGAEGVVNADQRKDGGDEGEDVLLLCGGNKLSEEGERVGEKGRTYVGHVMSLLISYTESRSQAAS